MPDISYSDLYSKFKKGREDIASQIQYAREQRGIAEKTQRELGAYETQLKRTDPRKSPIGYKRFIAPETTQRIRSLEEEKRRIVGEKAKLKEYFGKLAEYETELGTAEEKIGEQESLVRGYESEGLTAREAPEDKIEFYKLAPVAAAPTLSGEKIWGSYGQWIPVEHAKAVILYEVGGRTQEVSVPWGQRESTLASIQSQGGILRNVKAVSTAQAQEIMGSEEVKASIWLETLPPETFAQKQEFQKYLVPVETKSELIESIKTEPITTAPTVSPKILEFAESFGKGIITLSTGVKLPDIISVTGGKTPIMTRLTSGTTTTPELANITYDPTKVWESKPEKRYYVGRVVEGEPIYAEISPYLKKFGYKPKDVDYATIEGSLISQEKEVMGYLEGIETGIYSKEYLPKLEAQLESIRNIRSVVSGYKRLGYKVDIGKEGYEFGLPSALETHRFVHGREKEAALLSSAAFMESPLAISTLFAAGQQAITGDQKVYEARQEELAAFSLGLTEGLQKGDYVARVVTSPAMVSGVYMPLATLGVGYGIAGLTSKATTGISAFSTKVAQIFPRGTKVLSVATKPLTLTGKLMSTKAGEAITVGGLYGVLEAPRLYETYKVAPERLGGEIGGSLFAWGMAIGGFKAGSKLYQARHPVKADKYIYGEDWKARAVKEQLVLGQQDITVKPLGADEKFGRYEWWSGGKQYVTDIRSAKDISTRALDVEAYGKAITTKKDIYLMAPGLSGEPSQLITVPKGTTFTYGKGLVKDPITGRLVKTTTSRVFKMGGMSQEIQVPGLVDPEGVIPHIYKATGYSQLLSADKPVTISGLGIYETGAEGQVALTSYGTIKTPIRAGKAKAVIEQLDLSKNISTFYTTDTGKYMFLGKFKPLEADVGNVMQYGQLSTIKGEAIGKITATSIKPESLLSSKEAMASLVRPVTAGERILIEHIAPSVAGDVAASAAAIQPISITSQVPAIATGAKAGVILPSMIASSTKYIQKEDRLIAGARISSLISQVKLEEESKMKYGTRVTTDFLTGVTKERELGYGVRPGLELAGEFKLGEIEREELNLGLGSSLALGQVSLQEQEQALKLKTGLKLTGELESIAITPITMPGVPSIPPIPVPILLPGGQEEIRRKKKKKKPKKPALLVGKKKKRKPKTLLSDILSVTKTQAKFGLATHPKATEKLWKIGEKTMFKRVPTVEMLRGKKGKSKGKKNKLKIKMPEIKTGKKKGKGLI